MGRKVDRRASRLGVVELREMKASVINGSKKKAIEFALGANKTNGLRRTNADKKFCIMRAADEFPEWSDRQIAEACGVSNRFVGAQHKQVFP
jgi:hypothetical protein